MQFHKDDQCSAIVNVALNLDFEGGELIYVVRDELVRPCRKVGDATVHDGQIMHGVSRVSKGIRDTLVVIFK